MPPPPSKKRKTAPPPSELTFDPAARADFLTGFHKRKQARIKAAQEYAARKAREERIRERAELRQQRKAELERHVEAVNAMLREAGGEVGGAEGSGSEEEGVEGMEEEWAGFEEPPAAAEVNREDEYVDEDRYTTVTVEAVDIDREGIHNGEAAQEEKSEDEGGDGQRGETTADGASGTKKRAWTKEKPKSDRPKKKKKKFRYESKAERKVTRAKERSKNRAQAKERRG